MKIRLIGSMKFYQEYLKIKAKLEKKGHEIVLPLPDEVYSKEENIKRKAMEVFNKELEESQAILMANFEKNGIKNYIGMNSVMEIGMAFNRNKKIFILNKFPENFKEELQAIEAVELNGDLEKIK